MPLFNRQGKITIAVLVVGILFIVAVATLKPKPEKVKLLKKKFILKIV